MPVLRIGPITIVATSRLDELQRVAGIHVDTLARLIVARHSVEQRDRYIAEYRAELHGLINNLSDMFGPNIVAAACAVLGIQ